MNVDDLNRLGQGPMFSSNTPLCDKCGHKPNDHAMTQCYHVMMPTMDMCDCTGWSQLAPAVGTHVETPEEPK